MSNRQPNSRALTWLFLGLVLLLAVLWGSRPLVHDDLFFHLATGQHVVEHHEVPTTDLFSFTRNGERWVSHEWGFGVVAYLVWLAGDYRALVALKACLVVAILLLLLGLMQYRSEQSLTRPTAGHVALLAVGLWAIYDQLILRASLFSSLFVLFLLCLLYRFDRTGSRLAFATIAVLFLVWGNFHGEVLFGLFVLGVFTTEAFLARFRYSVPVPSSLLQASPARPYLKLFALSLLLTLVNPNGIQVLLYPFRLAWFLFARGGTLEMGHFTGATPVAAGGFFLLLAILLLGLLPLERLKALSLTNVVTVSVFLVLSLRSHRFIFYFTLFALPVIARLFAQSVDRRLPLLSSAWFRRAAVGLAMIAVATATAKAWVAREPRPVSRHFPSGAVGFLQQEGIGGRPFNHQNYGGYLHWKLLAPIFWDGRNLVFGPLMEEVREMPLDQVVAKWNLDYLLLTEFEFSRMGDQIDPAKWGLVYWDDFVAIFLRRDQDHRPALDHFELQQFPPFGGIEGLNLRATDDAWVARARRELDQILGFEPECQRALYLRGLISFYRGELEQAEDSFVEALAIGPNEHVSKALARVREGRPLA
jgi:hypothetical protein